MRRWALCAQVALLAVVGATVQANPSLASRAISAAQRSGSDDPAVRKTVVTPNWSGYVAVAPKATSYNHPYFTRVTGTWKVPVAQCSRRTDNASSTVWVGLGGYKSHDQEEVGTDSNCTATGKHVYYAWFELVPYPSYRTFPNISDTVSAGDTMTGLVRILSPTLVELRLRDATRGWIFSKNITFSSQDTTTADWVVEAPAECVLYFCHEASLSNFGSVTMKNISAAGGGSSGTLRDPRWKVLRVRLVPSKLLVPTLLPSPTAATSSTPVRRGRALSPAGATPGSLSRSGTSFNLRWVPVATRGV